MMPSNNVVIALPVHKSEMNHSEKNAFLQLFKILKNYPITLFTHKNLNLGEYYKVAGENVFSVEYFDSKYFDSTTAYSHLLCSIFFYKRFEKYNFLLIYQFDAWVFRDELEYWCGQNYDYIGAPWFSIQKEKNALQSFYGVGNGGFSLRKVSSHLKALRSFYRLVPIKTLIKNFLKDRFGFTSIRNLFYDATIRNFSHSMLTPNIIINEDIFWGLVAQRGFRWFKVPDMLTAAKFSFECNAKLLFKANNRSLPFGCHAWEIYEPDFWNEFIKE